MMTLVSELLLKNGHKVTAIVRDKTKLKVDHANLSKVQADVFNAETLVSVFKVNGLCTGYMFYFTS